MQLLSMNWENTKVLFYTADLCKHYQKFAEKLFIVCVKMANGLTIKSFCVLYFEKTWTLSATAVQRHFWIRYYKTLPNNKSIYVQIYGFAWENKRMPTGERCSSWFDPSNCSPQSNSINTEGEFGASIATFQVYKVFRKNLKMFPHKLQLLLLHSLN